MPIVAKSPERICQTVSKRIGRITLTLHRSNSAPAIRRFASRLYRRTAVAPLPGERVVIRSLVLPLIRYLRFAVLLVTAWTVMVTTHEVGHLLGGHLGGASLTDFDLAPWRLPYSLHQPDPHPKVSLWAGPLIDCLVPALVAGVAQSLYAWFVADFCVLANGGYLALAFASDDRYLDTTRMLDVGTNPATIVAFCLLTVPVGYIRFRRDCIALLTAPPTDNLGVAPE